MDTHDRLLSMRAILALSLILVGCGSSQASGSIATEGVQPSDLPTEEPEHHESCDLIPAMSTVQLVATVGSLTYDGQVSSSVVRIATKSPRLEYDGRVDRDDVPVVLSRFESVMAMAPFADKDAVDQAAQSPSAVLFVLDHRIAGPEQEMDLVKVIGVPDGAGSIALVGDCGREWQPALEDAAKSLGRSVDISFLVELSDPSSPAAVALSAAHDSATRAQTPPQEVPQSLRSLRIADVPVAARAEYRLIALDVKFSDPAYKGVIFVWSEGGISLAVAASGEGVVPILIPRNVGVLNVTSSVDAILDKGDFLIGNATPDQFDSVLGSRLSLVAGERTSADVRPLGAGELEKLTGMTRAELEAYGRVLLEGSTG
jgi:hypothetical protein